MGAFPPSEVGCFCDDKTADLILAYVNNKKLSPTDLLNLKSHLIEYLEWSQNPRGFDEEFVLGFISALFSSKPKSSLQIFFKERCYDGFALVNSKLNSLFCSNIGGFFSYCNNLKLPFLKTLTDAVMLTGLSPKDFAKKNKYNFESIFQVYKDWHFTGSCHPEDYADQIRDGSVFVDLFDFFGIEIKKVESPIHILPHKGFYSLEEDFKEAAIKCSKKECVDFSRFFSKEPRDWFERDAWYLKFEG
jgi:hypothetical protein